MEKREDMSSLTQIICLANSRKIKERCIAGIDINTGKLVRPVCDKLFPEDGRIPESVRLINGREPELLDILEIPLADIGNNFGFEGENLSILPGKWKIIGKVTSRDVINYCVDSPYVLHNSKKYVYPSYLRSLPTDRRYTLQLVQPQEFSISLNIDRQWQGHVKLANGEFLENINITDSSLVKKMYAGFQPPTKCLLLMSLSLPWADDSWKGERPCWKLIAGVIELTSDPPSLMDFILKQTDIEMKNCGLSIEQGRNYLLANFRKRSRRELTINELQQFLQYLRSSK